MPFVDTEVVAQQALQNGSQVGGGFQVALVEQVGLFEARPIGDDTPALQRTAREESYGRGTVIGAVVAIEARRATEFRNEGDDSLVPSLTHIRLDPGNRAVKRTKQIGETALPGAFVDMRVPSIKGQRADSGPSDCARNFAAVPAASAK